MKKVRPDDASARWMIGVGASAGGLEALTQFVTYLPSELPAPVIVAQHLAPHARSMMVELLARHASLPVVAVTDGMTLEDAKIYVIPPNHDADLVDGTLVLTVADERTRPKPSVDELFTSLARTHKSRTIGIILSGTGTDGSKGIQAIKAAGGLTLAQDDRSAKYDGMPRSAVGTGTVDSILPPEAIAKNLVTLIEEHDLRSRMRGLDESGVERLFGIVKEKLGQDFRGYKSATMQRRITKRMREVGSGSFDDYADLVQSRPGEAAALAQELLISVTTFFRDPEAFQILAAEIRKRISLKSGRDEFRIWCAGCATGEEAYSIAMLALDVIDRLALPVTLKVFATDLDQDAILEARTGIYSAHQVQGVAPGFLERFLIPLSSGQFEVSKRLRDVVVFARQDLIQNPPFVKLDIVSCRNVLIYFDSPLQKKVFDIFHYSLLPSGLLFLGKSESVSASSGLFTVIDKKSHLFEKINVASQAVPGGRLRSAAIDLSTAPRRQIVAGPSIAEQGYKLLFGEMGLAAVIVDAEGVLLHVLGDVTPFVGFQNSLADLRLANLLPKSSAVELHLLIRKALQEGGAHRSRSHKIPKGPKNATFALVARPLASKEESALGKSLVLIAFETKRGKAAPAASSGHAETETRVSELEQELHVTREHLQTVIEELGISNEELQSLNEELSSTNEEMQATNEELETTNEELQSSNEELTTVNEELAAKSAELKAVALSLENIQNSIGSPMVVLDSHLRLLRFNSEALKIFRISTADLGREITEVSANCEIPDFRERVRATLGSGQVSESLCEMGNVVFQMRIMPSLDEDHEIVGAIVIFIDNTARIRSQANLETSERRVRAIIDGSASQIALKDTHGRYLVANAAFCQFFSLPVDRVIGHTDRELLPERVASDFRDADLEVILKRGPVRREESIVVNGQRHVFFTNRFPLFSESDSHPSAVGTVAIDITSQVEAQDALRKSEIRYRAIVDDQAVFVCRFLPSGQLTFTNSLLSVYFDGGADGRRGTDAGIGRAIYEMFERKDLGAFRDAIDRLAVEKPISQVEVRALRPGALARTMRWILRGAFDADSRSLQEIQAVGFDVTELRAQTEELLQKEAIFGGIFNSTSDFITVFRHVDGHLVLESLNRSAERSVGISYSQLIGLRIDEFIAREDRDAVMERYDRVLESKRSEVFDEILHLPGGKRFFSTTLVPILGRDGDVERIAAMSRDVSSYKVIEADLRQAKDAAEFANRAKSDFLASMSHELRTPLNVVLGLCQILEHGPMEAEQMDHVRTIHRSGSVLLSLIEDILDISKIEAGKIKLNLAPFGVKAFAEEILRFFQFQASEKGISLLLDIEPGADQSIVGDLARVRQIVVNLIGNAIKFTDQGAVTLKIQGQQMNDASVEPAEVMLRFTVTDSGIGIREADHPKIFEKFSQVETGHSRRYGGTGLGLVISKHLAGLMKGEMGFTSEWGRGSSFWFTMRASTTARAPEPLRALPRAPERAPASLKVLAIDDNRESLKIIALFLQRLGHRMTLASSGAEAIDALKKDHFDVILMDVQMPGMDGYEATARIRRFNDGTELTPIIALTANAMSGDAERCRAAGMDDYLTKPVNMEALSGLLARWEPTEGARAVREPRRAVAEVQEESENG